MEGLQSRFRQEVPQPLIKHPLLAELCIGNLWEHIMRNTIATRGWSCMNQSPKRKASASRCEEVGYRVRLTMEGGVGATEARNGNIQER